MKILQLALWVLCCFPSLLQAAVDQNIEFRFVTDSGESATEYVFFLGKKSYFIEDRVILSGADFNRIGNIKMPSGSSGLSFKLTNLAYNRFNRITTLSQGKTLAMLINDEIVTFIPIRGQINSNNIWVQLHSRNVPILAFDFNGNRIEQKTVRNHKRNQTDAPKDLILIRNVCFGLFGILLAWGFIRNFRNPVQVASTPRTKIENTANVYDQTVSAARILIDVGDHDQAREMLLAHLQEHPGMRVPEYCYNKR